MDFEKEIDRLGTNCIKWDLMKVENKPEGTIPMWVADMDFEVCDGIKEALKECVEHGIYGYSFAGDRYYEAVCNWYKKHFHFEFKKENVVITPGVVTAVAAAVRAFTNEGDHIMIQQPVYYPFKMMVEQNGRKIVDNPLMNVEGRYIMDIEDFERKIMEEDVKMFILCSPHNPVGRVWTLEELTEVAKICERHGVIVISDEIHSDFVYDEHTHYPFAAVLPGCKDFTVTCTAPSKTFNIAGLRTSNIIIFNEELKKKFEDELNKLSVGGSHPFGIAACTAAYETGEEWLNGLKEQIVKNRDFMMQFLEDELPEMVMSELEGTYLAWVDMTGLALSNEDLKAFLANDAKLWLDDGDMFGVEGEGFARFNLACTHKTLEKALNQLKDAVLKRYK